MDPEEDMVEETSSRVEEQLSGINCHDAARGARIESARRHGRGAVTCGSGCQGACRLGWRDRHRRGAYTITRAGAPFGGMEKGWGGQGTNWPGRQGGGGPQVRGSRLRYERRDLE